MHKLNYLYVDHGHKDIHIAWIGRANTEQAYIYIYQHKIGAWVSRINRGVNKHGHIHICGKQMRGSGD